MKKSNEDGENCKQCSEYKELLQRVQADFENYKKRCERETFEFRERSGIDLVVKLLPVLDSFEMALKYSEPNGKFADGLRGIYAQLYSVLEGYGLKRINTIGKVFDPYLHEVLLIEKSDQDNMILEELQSGYMFKGAVIRHSKVKVGKKSDDDDKMNSKEDGKNG